MKIIITVMSLAMIFGGWVIVAATAAQQSPLPMRDQPTIQDVKEQLADCSINAASQQRYEAKLVARIRELEKELKAKQ